MPENWAFCQLRTGRQCQVLQWRNFSLISLNTYLSDAIEWDYRISMTESSNLRESLWVETFLISNFFSNMFSMFSRRRTFLLPL